MDFISVQKCVPVDSKYKEKEMLYIQGREQVANLL